MTGNQCPARTQIINFLITIQLYNCYVYLSQLLKYKFIIFLDNYLAFKWCVTCLHHLSIRLSVIDNPRAHTLAVILEPKREIKWYENLRAVMWEQPWNVSSIILSRFHISYRWFGVSSQILSIHISESARNNMKQREYIVVYLSINIFYSKPYLRCSDYIEGNVQK
jgi:hypothetical protein